jgi:predicted small lipoprotein YifL
MTLRRLIVLLLIVMVAAPTIAACGRKGDLHAPPGEDSDFPRPYPR